MPTEGRETGLLGGDGVKRRQLLAICGSLLAVLVVVLATRHGVPGVGAALGRLREGLAELPDAESLILMGMLLFCGAGLCVFRAARDTRASVVQVRCGSTEFSGGLPV